MSASPPEHIAEIIRQLEPEDAGKQATAFSPIAISLVQLCYFSYNSDPTTTIPTDVADPAKVFPPLNDTYWECLWGPVLDDAQGNLVFIAGLSRGSPVQPITSAPLAVAVVTRGTDPTGVWSSFQQLYEDMSPTPMWNPPWNDNTQEWVANGTLDALSNISPLTWNGRTVPEYLASLPTQDRHEPVILITGHSLGGCLSTTIAPWLATTLPPRKTAWMTVVTFAAPTAGNQVFVDDLLTVSPFTTCYYNPLDCIPLAWWNLDGIDGIYGTSYPTPYAIEGWVATMNAVTWDDPYVPVPSGNIPQLDSIIIDISDPIFGLEFMQEVAAQHACANYMLLMGLVPPYAASPKATPMQRLQPLGSS